MKAVIAKENLQRALGFVDRITSKNTTLPILNNILLKTEDNCLRLSATNLEVGVSSTIHGKIDSEGCIAVPGRILSDFIRGASHETVTLGVQGNTLTVQAGSFKTTILGFDGSEFPIIPKLSATHTRVMPASTLRGMLVSITDCIALSDSRPELAGAMLEFQPSSTILVATDSFRLAEHLISTQNEQLGTLIIPRTTIQELSRTLSDIEGDIQIITADNQVAFIHDDVEIVSRLVDGKYPNYKPFIPDTFLSKVLVRTSELQDAVKVASLFSSSIADIKFECTDKEIHIGAKNTTKGEAQTSVECSLKGEPFEITLNHHYLLDGLKVIKTDAVVLEFTGKGSPFVLRPHSENKEVVYLIMPLRG